MNDKNNMSAVEIDEEKLNNINPNNALDEESIKLMRLPTYAEIQRLREDPSCTVFQDLFMQYYRVQRRTIEWQERYFELMGKMYWTGGVELKDILLELLKVKNKRAVSYVDLSFASKLLSTVEPDNKPIWDSQVVGFLRKSKLLTVKDMSGRSKLEDEERIGPALENYESIERFYEIFRQTEKAEACLKAFDDAIPLYADDIAPMKKLDFILWSLGREK